MGWVPLMLVCRLWRNVGIQTPWLWRRIGVTSNLEALQYHLSRTVGCTIDLILSYHSKGMKESMPLLLPFAHSIRSIQTEPSEPIKFKFESLPLIKALFEAPLPALETVNIQVYTRDPRWQEAGPFDLGLSGKLHPRVRRLDVASHIAIPCTPNVWGALRSLRACIDGVVNRDRPVDDILRVLAGAPNLESLVVSEEHYSYDSESSPANTIAPNGSMPILHRLHNLRKIRLEGSFWFVARVLKRIDAPALSIFHVSACPPANVDVADSAALLFPPPLRHILSKSEHLYVSANNALDFQICSHAKIRTPRDFLSWENDSVPLIFRVTGYTWSTSPLSTALSALRDGFQTAPLQTLSFERLHVAAPVVAWKTLQVTFPDLRSVRIGSKSLNVIYCFFLALRELALKGGWPLLSCLEVDFGRISDYSNSLSWHLVLQPLVEATRAWNEQGLRLEDIIFQTLRITRRRFGPHRRTFLAISMLCGRFIYRSPFYSNGTFCDKYMVDVVSELLPTTPEWRTWSGRHGRNIVGKEANGGPDIETSFPDVEFPEIETM
ncbi:hypothetical protein DICSQDRAFT_181244, partial [Dichomitus squalens LYAD-421 SS1]